MKPIDDIIKNFDWEKVHEYMTHVNWQWFKSNAVPTIEEMQQEVRRMYRDAKEKKLRFISTGGFTLFRNDHEYWLLFAVTDWITERKPMKKIAEK